MTLRKWYDDSVERVSTRGWDGVRVSAMEFSVGALRRLGRSWNYGESIFARDWEVLVVLDACRHDLLVEVADEYDWLPDVIPAMNSLGSTSHEWIEKNFGGRGRELGDIAYVCGNVFSDSRLDADDWWLLDEVWKVDWDDDHGHVPPRPITDRTIRLLRREDRPPRVVAHYMQPHAPFVGLDGVQRFTREQAGDLGATRYNVWDMLRYREISTDEAWAAYRDTLRWALDDVALLVENVDASVTLTADHGNAFGRLGCYSHPGYVPLPELKRVPWVTVEGTDRGTHDPSFGLTTEATASDEEVRDRLADLGYL